MKHRTAPSSWVIVAAVCGFLAGMLVMAALGVIFPAGPMALTGANAAVDLRPSWSLLGGVKAAEPGKGTIAVLPTPEETPPVAPAPPPPPGVPIIAADPLVDLRKRGLTLPLEGARTEDLRDSFSELRGRARRHEAIDIIAPRHTPVVAVEDGTIARLFYSDAGGITIYQFDPSTTYVYYYAHLERYASGLDENDTVRRGQTIGYVGTSGNAPRNTPHLHFAIFKMTDKKQWWQGTAIDPYSVLK